MTKYNYRARKGHGSSSSSSSSSGGKGKAPAAAAPAADAIPVSTLGSASQEADPAITVLNASKPDETRTAYMTPQYLLDTSLHPEPSVAAPVPPQTSDVARHTDDSTWPIAEQSPIAPGYLAWDLLSIGRRFEMWIAWDQVRLTPVCIKMPRSDQMKKRPLAALRRELEAARSFDHPAIPRVFFADLDAVRPYVVYEFIEGRTLSHMIDDDGPLDNNELVLLGLQIAATLRYVHGRGFVHLDLKPSNILMRGDRAIISDFDISLPIGAQRSKRKPRGTRQYLSPEQIRCEPAQPVSDIFALGAVLYKAASGITAYSRDVDNEPSESSVAPDTFRQNGPPIPLLSKVAEQIKPEVAAAVDHLMALDKTQRPATATEAINLLATVITPNELLWPPWLTPTITPHDLLD